MSGGGEGGLAVLAADVWNSRGTTF